MSTTRRTILGLVLSASGLLACQGDIASEDGASTTKSSGSESGGTQGTDDDDTGETGDTGTPEPLPCEIEWIRREPALVADPFVDMVARPGGPRLVSQVLQDGLYLTQLSDFSSDGELDAVTELALGAGDELLTSLLMPSDAMGETFSASEVDGAPELGAKIRSFSAAGQEQWGRDLADLRDVWMLDRGAAGALIYGGTLSVAPTDTDVRVGALDAQTGEELWAWTDGGELSTEGDSPDVFWTLDVDAQGTTFVGYQEFVESNTLASDTLAPVVTAVDAQGQTLWSTLVIDEPHSSQGPRAIAGGPDGSILVSVQDWSGGFHTRIVALEAETGEQRWLYDFEDLPDPRIFTAAMDLGWAGGRTRVIGYWSYIDEANGDQQVVQAFVLGLDDAGILECVETHDEYDPAITAGRSSWVPLLLDSDAEANFYLGGFVGAYFPGDFEPELLVGRVH